MRNILMLALIVAINLTAFSQDNQTEKEKDHAFSYAYISVEGKIFSKKLKVEVDLGDTPEQIKTGQGIYRNSNKQKIIRSNIKPYG